MDINNILESSKIELLTEAGIRIPAGTKAFKILHHDDADGLGSAKMARKQIHNQVFKQFRKENPNKSDKEIGKIIDSRITSTEVTDSSKPDYVEKILKSDPNQMVLVVDFDRFTKFGDKVKTAMKAGAVNFQSDHHESDDPITKGGGKTGATEFKSDTEHLATKNVTKGVDAKAVLAFSDADSATFRESLTKSLGLEKSDSKKLKLIGDLFINLSQFARGRKHRKAVALFIKNSGDSLLSMNTYAKKLADAINLQVKGQGALNKKVPNQKLADEVRNELIKKGFKSFALDVKKGTQAKFVNTPENLKEKNVKDFADKDKYFAKAGKYVVLSDLSGSKQPSRYLGFTVPNDDPDVKKYFAMMRSWSGMGFFQVSLSPEAPKEVKDKVNLVEIMKKVFGEVKKKFETKYNKWAFNIVDEEMGGHAGITNAGGMGLFGLMPKKMREEYKALVPISKRVKSLKVMKGRKKEDKIKKAEFLARVPGLAKQIARLDELEAAKKEYSKNKVKVMGYFKTLMIEAVNKEIEKAVGSKKEAPVTNESVSLKNIIIENVTF